ncbi:MAG TPA: prepilin-type N-terminal cleavage/methylation domain-containing protein [Gammaproteobacteria bacterium]|nr:prepilin-type N-terminal cleavage/methylation domain-containing protein [Gammaproteobacteria bacterium]
MNFHHAKGFTLMEMIVAIVVLTAAVSGILFAFLQNTARSADPMIRQQAIIIAQAYLEEIMLKPYNDPNGGETGSCEEGAGNRIQYDDVADYNCVNDNTGAIDQFGNSLAGLGAYNVTVAVTDANMGAPAVAARRVNVTVTHDTIPVNIAITGYRTSYF